MTCQPKAGPIKNGLEGLYRSVARADAKLCTRCNTGGGKGSRRGKQFLCAEARRSARTPRGRGNTRHVLTRHLLIGLGWRRRDLLQGGKFHGRTSGSDGFSVCAATSGPRGHQDDVSARSAARNLKCPSKHRPNNWGTEKTSFTKMRGEDKPASKLPCRLSL